MKEGVKFFKLDGPIGRKRYFFVSFFASIYLAIAVLLMITFHYIFEVSRYNLIFFILLWGAILLSTVFVFWTTVTKRLWDLIGDKNNSIFYSSAFFILSFAMNFIPYLKIVGIILSVIVGCILLFKKGKFVNVKQETEENAQ